MNVLAMSKYKAVEGLMNYSANAAKKASSVPFFPKERTIFPKLKSAQASGFSPQEITAEMSTPIFKEFIRLLVG